MYVIPLREIIISFHKDYHYLSNFLFWLDDPKPVENKEQTPPPNILMVHPFCRHLQSAARGGSTTCPPLPKLRHCVCIYTSRSARDTYDSTCNVHCNKRSLRSSWLHLFSLVALSLSLSLSVGIYAIAEQKFILSKSRQTLRACVVHNVSSCLITTVYCTGSSVHL